MTPCGRSCRTGSASISACASPLTTPCARSAPTSTRRFWLYRWMVVGPEPKLISATRDSGTLPPVMVWTGRFSIVVRSSRDCVGSFTRMGIWRSDRENLAAFCSISPSVAMRIVWLMAAVVTPSSAARSGRGVMISSGRLMSALMRGAIRESMPFICSTSVAAVSSSSSGLDPASITVMSALPGPPDCEAKRTCASGIFASSGASALSN